MGYLIGGYIFIVLVVTVLKKVNAYEAFLKGAKEGTTTVLNMFSTLLGFVLIVESIKSCGILEDLGKFINPNLFIQSIIRPLSASSSLAIMLDVFESSGVDSKNGIMSTFLHTTLDTSIYMVALYFGSANIKKYRYTFLLIFLVTIITYILIFFLVKVFF